MGDAATPSVRAHGLGGLCAAFCLVACGGSNAPMDGAGLPPDSGQAQELSLDAPEAPRLPCPEGWSRVPIGDAVGCEPFSADAPACADNQVRFPGEPACHLLGPPCPPSRGFAEGIDTERSFFVRQGADGDGRSPSEPSGDLRGILAAARPDDTVWVAEGRYEESALAVPEGVTLRGTCLGAELEISLFIRGGSRLSDVTLSGGSVTTLGAATVERVRFQDASRPLAVDSREGEEVLLRDLSFRRCGVPAVSIAEGAVDAERIEIREPRSLPAAAVGVSSDDPARVADAYIEASGDFGFSVVSGSELRVERTFVRDSAFANADRNARLLGQDVHGSGDGGEFPWILAFGSDGEGGVVDLERASLRGHSLPAFSVADHARLSGRDIVLGAALPTGAAVGLFVQRAGSALLERVRMEGPVLVGIQVSGVQSFAELRDVVIADPQPRPDGTLGRALQVQNGARVEGMRLQVLRARGAGVVAAEGASALLRDISIEATAARACAPACLPAGVGAASWGGELVLERFALRDSFLAGGQVAFGGTLVLRDGEVANNAIGVSVQIEGYDLGQLQEGVAYRNNGTNLGTTAIAVPEPVVPRFVP